MESPDKATTPIPPALLAATPQQPHLHSPPPEEEQPPTSAPIPPQPAVKIAVPDVSLADDDTAVARIVSLVNVVYTTTEEGLFAPTYRRTHDAEVRGWLRAGEMAVAWTEEESQPTAATIMGCIRFFALTKEVGDFGVLACDPAYRGTGTGRRLVGFAEGECARRGMGRMQCELLVSREFEHPFKARLQAWYERMGYVVVRRAEFGGEHPALARHLVTRAELRVFEKGLSVV
ncbi:hypothetical protein B0T16DRAFT_124439 [Cercophora newfieldiana]|uniref:N-acetyltransferase domain-containing protein n=1 Tax=Cercophora newfieldiana TaxID=92897 RepID=A0AA40CSF5_9PEZI|nr:hypothetical protein B0T16DRAFT_124439 [Cercophora newfieldiana]